MTDQLGGNLCSNQSLDHGEDGEKWSESGCI